MRQIFSFILIGASSFALSAASTGATGATGSADPSQVAHGGGGGGGHGGGGGRGGDFRGGGDFHGGEFRGNDGFENRGNLNRDARQFENRGQWDAEHGVYINGGAENLYPLPVPLYDNGGDPVDSSYYDDSNQIYNQNNNGQY